MDNSPRTKGYRAGRRSFMDTVFPNTAVSTILTPARLVLIGLTSQRIGRRSRLCIFSRRRVVRIRYSNRVSTYIQINVFLSETDGNTECSYLPPRLLRQSQHIPLNRPTSSPFHFLRSRRPSSLSRDPSNLMVGTCTKMSKLGKSRRGLKSEDGTRRPLMTGKLVSASLFGTQ